MAVVVFTSKGRLGQRLAIVVVTLSKCAMKSAQGIQKLPSYRQRQRDRDRDRDRDRETDHRTMHDLSDNVDEMDNEMDASEGETYRITR